jgi:hypothetical protein
MDAETSNREQNTDPGKDCQEASSLATTLLTDRGIDLAQYKLISAENLIRGDDYAGPHLWRLTFKLKGLIPATSDAPVGKGGELFVLVDLSARKARLIGYGE